MPSSSALVVACSSSSSSLLVLARRVAPARGAARGLTRGSDGRASRPSSMRTSKGLRGRPRGSTTSAARTAVLEARPAAGVPAVGLVRFNPFEETGGNQSFALALLDADGDGWVLSSLHARSGRASTPRRSSRAGRSRPVRGGDARRSSRRRPDSLGDTAVRDGPGMAPTIDRRSDHRPPRSTNPPPSRVTRPRPRRREPAPLDQLPAWRELVPVMDPGARRAEPEPGLDALLGGLEPGPAARGDARRRAAARRRRRRDRQDPGHHAPDRLARSRRAGPGRRRSSP